MSETVRTAYLLQIHTNPQQVNMFINQLIDEGAADVFVHIDKRTYEQVYPQLIKNQHVKILRESIKCEWGDISQVAATILLLKEVMRSHNNYDFVCLRSGQDLLVRNGFKKFLVENRGNVFMNFKDIGKENLCVLKVNWPKGARKRYTSAHPYRIFRRIIQELYHRGINLYPNTNYWPKEFNFYCGSQWFTIPFEVASFVVEFLEKNDWYFNFFTNAYCPDEWFFHTLIMNSPFKSNVVKNNLLYLKWGEKFSERNSPQYLTYEDITSIEQSLQFFARKFDKNIDPNVIDYFTSYIKYGNDTNYNTQDIHL
ncbi:beta-1,6-N-acetylglucosaminyltransferase [Neobacillus jeddahensis]|uniref:beta-1,6-N-acetylglucosaminyltransferase n=1 Tax=Neobacillus jeddahensis TaxID=1461580 RepID=UPI00058B79A0|nr:beta-1,6-N-acetylglucosaminyltransferase [Neobacillus jeddahensis]